jgi:hypothetical protein
VITVFLAATAIAVVSLNGTAQPAVGAPPAPSFPDVPPQPGINPRGWATTPPAAGCSRPVRLDRVDGAWVLGYNDDRQQASPVPGTAGRFGLLDFDWLSFTTPGNLTQADPFDQPLSRVLSSAARESPCSLRFVTISDASAKPGVMARILTRPLVMNAHVAAIARLMAGEPDATGLTLDYEFALPRTAGDLAVYAKVAGWHDQSLAQQVNELTTDYTRLVQMVALAMHRQHRLLRLACLVRNNDVVASEQGNVAPYLLDYGKLADYADQLVLMAVDFHYSTGNPGPIAPLADVTPVAGYVRSYGIPLFKLALEIPNYSYDWQVDAEGDIATTASGQVIPAQPLTATQLAAVIKAGHWRLLGTRDGETEYSDFTTVSGKAVRHIIWDASTALSFEKGQLGKSLPGIPIDVWQIGNNDPIGTAMAEKIK